MKIYLAAMYSQKPLMEKYAKELRDLGFEVTASWLEESHHPHSKMSDLTNNELVQYAIADLNDIDKSDILVFFSQDPETATVRGGRHVEVGYALAKNKAILVVGPAENIFHYLPNIRQVNSWAAALDYMEVMA